MGFVNTASKGQPVGQRLRSNFSTVHESPEFSEARRRASMGSEAYADDVFQREHGMSRAAWNERERLIAQERAEAAALAGLDDDPMDWLSKQKTWIYKDSALDKLTSARKRYAVYRQWLAVEESKLAKLANKRDGLQAVVAAPAEVESSIRAFVRRTADAMLGKGKAESDAEAWAALNRKHSDQKLQAAAASVAIEDLEPEIKVAEMRVARLQERESEFLNPVLNELAFDIEQVLDRKEAEIAALKRLLEPLWQNYRLPYGTQAERPEAPDVAIAWPLGWHGLADKLRADPLADVAEMLPNTKGIA